MEKLKLHIGLTRSFALPVAACAVALGCVLAGASWWLTVLAVSAGAFMMFFAHTANAWLDFYWTRFDMGTAEERSRPKAYTEGQQPLAAGLVGGREVLANAFLCLAVSAILTVFVAIHGSAWVWLGWGLAAASTFWYSWGKMHFQCELALGLGFGSFAVMYGACTAPNPELGTAFLAGLPFVLVWGFVAEVVDQFTDAEPNWPRGLRNLGALVWRNEVSISMFTAWLVAVTYLVQLVLVLGGILAWQTGLTLATFLPFSFCFLYLEKNLKAGVLWGLGAVFLYMALLTAGQALA